MDYKKKYLKYKLKYLTAKKLYGGMKKEDSGMDIVTPEKTQTNEFPGKSKSKAKPDPKPNKPKFAKKKKSEVILQEAKQARQAKQAEAQTNNSDDEFEKEVNEVAKAVYPPTPNFKARSPPNTHFKRAEKDR
jgi:hypothetical protein